MTKTFSIVFERDLSYYHFGENSEEAYADIKVLLSALLYED